MNAPEPSTGPLTGTSAGFPAGAGTNTSAGFAAGPPTDTSAGTSTGPLTDTSAGPSTSATPRVRDVWRRWRMPLAFVGVLLLVVTAGSLITRPKPGGYLDPVATTAEGAHALVQLLRDQGVEVLEATSLDQAEELAADGSLLLIGDAGYLFGPSAYARVAALPGDRLLVEPADRLLTTLAPALRYGPDLKISVREPGCPLPAATRAGGAAVGGSEIIGARTRCYDGALAVFTEGGRTTTVLSSGEFMTNARLAENGNAALAMNLAGASSRLVWFVPHLPVGYIDDFSGQGNASLTDLLPGGVKWGVLTLALAVLLLAVARGRRLGPIVTERLPVVVRASETMEGRARLYRARRSRDRAAAALRLGTLDRLLPRLGLVSTSTQDQITSATAARTGHDSTEIRQALYGGPPTDDPGLVRLARQLDGIERQVRDS